MTNKQDGCLKMSLSTTLYLTANATITAGLPNFTNYFTVIQTTNTQILAVQQLQELDKTGITASKNQLRQTLATLAIDIGRRVQAYAINVGNSVLLAEVNYSESDLKRSTDTEIRSRCQVIYDRANANVTALTPYGVTAANLASLLTSITNYNTAFPKGRVGTTDTEQATQQLTALFKTLMDNYNKVDMLVEMVRTTQPNFYNEYKKVRKIIDTGAKSLILKANVSDSETGDPLANATLTFTPTNGMLKAVARTAKSNGNGLSKKTAAGGGLHMKSMEDGTYLVIASKPGYKDKEVTVSVVNGEMTVLNIDLEKA